MENQTCKIEDGVLLRYLGEETNVIVPEGVTKVGKQAFSQNCDVQTITLPHSLRVIESGAFSRCAALERIEIPEGVTEMGFNAFEACHSLVSVSLPRTLAVIPYSAFAYCSSLTEITIPEGVTEIDDEAFNECYALKQAALPASLWRIGNNAFANCTHLAELILPEGVTEIGESAFENCTALLEVVLPASLRSLYSNAFEDCENLMEVTFGSGLTEIGYCAFEGCRSLLNVNLPNTLHTIGQSAFSKCAELTTLTLPASLRQIKEYAFFRCEKLSVVLLPDALEEVASFAFFGCAQLTKLYIPATVTDIGAGVLGGCDNLMNLEVSRHNPRYRVVEDCIVEPAQKTLVAGTHLGHIPADGSVTTIGESAFTALTGVPHVDIPAAIRTIKANAFFGSDLNSVSFAEGLKTIGYQAFAECDNLSALTLPASVETVADRAFSPCRSLKTLTVPGTLAALGEYAFYRCTKLRRIYWPNPPAALGNGAFAECARAPIWLADKRFRKGASTNACIAAAMTWLETPNKPDRAAFKESIASYQNELLLRLLEQGDSRMLSALLDRSMGLVYPIPFLRTVIERTSDATVRATLMNYMRATYSQKELDAFDQEQWDKAMGEKPYTTADWEALFTLRRNGGGIEITRYIGTALDVVVPGRIDGLRVSVGRDAFLRSSICSLVVEEGADCIHRNAFAHSALRSVTIREGLTVIDGDAFAECAQLRDVYLPASLRKIEMNWLESSPVGTVHYAGTKAQCVEILDRTEQFFKTYSIQCADGTI